MSSKLLYTTAELADLANVTPRTVRYYVANGLLPSSGRPGPGAKFGNDHLARILLIRRLQRDHLPLAEIRRRLESLGEDSLMHVKGDAREGPDTALEYVRSALSEMHGSTSAEPRSHDRSETVDPSAPKALKAAGSTPSHPLDRSRWERVPLTPDVELHLRRPLGRHQQKQVERLIAIGRELLEEDGT
jgi:DNA-binding transcriptional MerR regulator